MFAEGVTGSDGLEEAEFDGLDGGHIAYTVVKKQDGEKDIVLYTNDASVDADSCMVHREFDTNTRYVLSGQAVSYTHLDVYKRQSHTTVYLVFSSLE